MKGLPPCSLKGHSFVTRLQGISHVKDTSPGDVGRYQTSGYVFPALMTSRSEECGSDTTCSVHPLVPQSCSLSCEQKLPYCGKLRNRCCIYGPQAYMLFISPHCTYILLCLFFHIIGIDGVILNPQQDLASILVQEFGALSAGTSSSVPQSRRSSLILVNETLLIVLVLVFTRYQC